MKETQRVTLKGAFEENNTEDFKYPKKVSETRSNNNIRAELEYNTQALFLLIGSNNKLSSFSSKHKHKGGKCQKDGT